MGEHWTQRWTRTELTRRGALRRFGGAAVAAGYVSGRKGVALAQAQHEGYAYVKP